MRGGDNIRALRQREGLTQLQLALLLGVAKETVCRWESGKALPRQQYIDTLIRRFALTRDDLLSEERGLAAQDQLHIKLTSSSIASQTPPKETNRTNEQSEQVPTFRIVRSAQGESLERMGAVFIPPDILHRHPHGALIRMGGPEMNQIYPEGSLLLVDPDLKPWNGCSVVAFADNASLVIRRYCSGNNMIILSSHSHGTANPDLMLDKRRVRILGIVVWWMASHDIAGI